MEFIDPDSVKRMAKAREHMLKFQQRIFKLEYLLEDLTRSVEIARYVVSTLSLRCSLARPNSCCWIV